MDDCKTLPIGIKKQLSPFMPDHPSAELDGRGLHSSTFQLNLSRF